MGEREYPRVSLQAEASIRHGDRSFLGMLANLSLNGVYIATETPLPVGDGVEVTFSDAASGMATVKAGGHVVRTDKEGMAFRLRRMDVDSFINLHAIVARLAAID